MGSDMLGQTMGKTVSIRMQHFADTSDVRSSKGGSGGVFAGDQHMHLAATGQCGGDGVQGGGFDVVVIVFCDD